MKKMRTCLGCVFFLLLAGFSAFSSEYQYKFAICSMFKNEAQFLKEWIEFHRLIGAEHFYLYNNESTDNYLEVLKPYIDKNIVELIDWESTEEHAIFGIDNNLWVPYQIGAFTDCIKNRALGKVQWVGVIDIDEFIFPVTGRQTFMLLLDCLSKSDIGSILLFWRCFGTSGIWDLNEGELLTEKLNQCSLISHPWNYITKCIHRPEAINLCTCHCGKEFNYPYKQEFINPEVFRINHYWFRTRKQMVEKRGFSIENSIEFEKGFNLENDTFMNQYLPKLKKAMEEGK